jgi:hypothetical protein
VVVHALLLVFLLFGFVFEHCNCGSFFNGNRWGGPYGQKNSLRKLGT